METKEVKLDLSVRRKTLDLSDCDGDSMIQIGPEMPRQVAHMRRAIEEIVGKQLKALAPEKRKGFRRAILGVLQTNPPHARGRFAVYRIRCWPLTDYLIWDHEVELGHGSKGYAVWEGVSIACVLKTVPSPGSIALLAPDQIECFS